MPGDYSESRRKFMGYTIGGIAATIAFGYLVPLANYIVRPSLRKPKPEWSQVGSVSDLQADEPRALAFTLVTKVGWTKDKEEQDVWVVKKPDGSLTVFSPICPHLGCGYRWDDATRHFVCPCHLSVYDINGKVLSGPAPRPLDTLPAKVEDGILYVKFEKFRLGIAQKILA
jgi:menaquinol-cytochrome c reductase iron-sulfur subunit